MTSVPGWQATGVGAAVAGSDSPAQPAAAESPAASGTADSPAPSFAPGYSWYRWMISRAGYDRRDRRCPGPRVSPVAAQRLGAQAPAGASVNRAARTITFTSMNVHLAALASPSMPAESFRIAGLTDPTISVPAGAHA